MKLIATFCLFFTVMNIYGNGIEVSAVSFDSNTNQLSFTLSWENSWTLRASDPDLFDAAWVFIKYAPNGGDTWHHASVLDSVPKFDYIQYISYDDLGILVYKSPEGAGNFGPQEFTVELENLLGGYQDFKVFATEMVFIDEGSFNAGDASSSGRFYQDGLTTAPWYIQSEDAILRGNSVGQFNQEGSISTSNLSANFPKGYSSIFCMKYKITAQQYVDFLNCLDRSQQVSRVKADLSGITASNKYVLTDSPIIQDRNPIACNVNIGTGSIEFFLDYDDTDPPNSLNDGGNIVLNHLSPADIIAYFDWSGLRPITELEYEKICRGTDMPSVAGEYAWGTSTFNSAGNITSPGSISESTSNLSMPSLFKLAPLRSGYAATSTSTRTKSGATFWGLMDIHNLGEFMYGVESANFTNISYGDGELDINGNANVLSWTIGAQLLCTQNSSAPNIEAISKSKTNTGLIRSASMGARGVRRIINPL